MILARAILVLCFAALFAQSGDMPPTPVAQQTEEFAVKARREGQVGPQIPIPPDLFAKVTETISVYPTICDAPYEYKGSETFAVQGRGYCYYSWARKTASGFIASTEANTKGVPRILKKSFPEDPPACVCSCPCSGRLLRRGLFSENPGISTFNRLNHVLLGVLFGFEDLGSYRVTVSAVFRGYFDDT
jgi:hypothetical protein